MPVDQSQTGAFHLQWDLVGRGWARCHLADGSNHASLTVSYCTDALADLLAATGGLYGQGRSSRFSFDAEPQELRWVLRHAGEAIDVTIYKFPDLAVSSDLPDCDGTVIWESAHPRRAFSHAVLDTAQNVLSQHGEAGYRAQ
ncbi:hypothetical protein [Streptomyces sp. SP2-10]|uniref:hypothetical protein n=1 Tax=Streptomyces sp. SP2-10 TaxID=2873385 RepID=UPI001CA78A1E|nr:hypothetical protein [Streptomyces sp. SP2-10]MBY8847104.1 hypothetical protein [Streptomyces sp. SP2-10]